MAHNKHCTLIICTRYAQNLTRADHNVKCHAPGTDGFTPPPKDAVQGAPHLLIVFKKLSGHLTEAKVHLFSALKSRLSL